MPNLLKGWHLKEVISDLKECLSLDQSLLGLVNQGEWAVNGKP